MRISWGGRAALAVALAGCSKPAEPTAASRAAEAVDGDGRRAAGLGDNVVGRAEVQDRVIVHDGHDVGAHAQRGGGAARGDVVGAWSGEQRAAAVSRGG